VLRYVVSSPLSLARVLWWYGEDELWQAALELPPTTLADLASRFAELHAHPELVETLWPGAPAADAHLVLGVIEHLEGRVRPAARRSRRGSPLPAVLDVAEEERWRDPVLTEVLRLVDERADSPASTVPVWRRHRLHGRYASG
jgi:hypothetical protein